MYVWIFVFYSELEDTGANLEPPTVYRTKKAAMKAFDDQVKKVLEEVGEFDEITNRIEKPGYLYLSVNGEDYYTVYVKKTKVVE